MFELYFGHLSIGLLNVDVKDIIGKWTTVDMSTWESFHKNIPFKTMYFKQETL